MCFNILFKSLLSAFSHIILSLICYTVWPCCCSSSSSNAAISNAVGVFWGKEIWRLGPKERRKRITIPSFKDMQFHPVYKLLLFILQQDNNPKHSSKLCQNYIHLKEKQNVLRIMTWPEGVTL
ncbi:hypothetical protein LDENG_00018700, partial [Lucifuga dentata]